MTTPLKHSNIFHTRDLSEAREEVARVFCAHDLSLTSAQGRLNAVHNGVRVDGVGLNYLRYGDEVRITPGRLDTFFLMQIPLAGRANVRVGSTTVMSDRRRASLISPTEPVDMVWSDGCEQLLVYLDRAAVERFAGGLSGSEDPRRVVFSPGVDLDGPGMRSWMRVVHLMREEIEAGDTMLTSSLARAHFEQFLIGGLLSSQPSDLVDALEPRSQRPASTARAVRRATELIEAAPERPWRVAELAAEARVTVRQLQDAFQRERGAGPMEVLRRVRLEHTRKALLNASPTETTVSEIAVAWGFTHLGRFSGLYREAYQESPSQTLAR
ncbi:MAG: AraC family transcriptional regulator [Herbiconiux sp.]|nr:AraC family transcriptional regulator [Herbiconiux sp.]